MKRAHDTKKQNKSVKVKYLHNYKQFFWYTSQRIMSLRKEIMFERYLKFFSYHWLFLSQELYFSVKSLESEGCLWCLNSKQIWSPHVQPYRLLVEPVQRHAHPSCCCQEKKEDNDPVSGENSDDAGSITQSILHLCTVFNKKKNLFCLSWHLHGFLK